MNKVMKLLPALLMLIYNFKIWGCRMRTYTVEKPRADLEITGNQGYLHGKPGKVQVEKKKKLSSQRKFTVLEVELGKHPDKEKGQLH